MAVTKLTFEQRKTLLSTGATAAEIQLYADEGFVFEEIRDLCETAAATKSAQATKLMQEQAKATADADAAQRDHEKIDKPHHGKSHYNPAGGEKPKLKVAEFYWAGDPLHMPFSTISATEIEKLNQLVPGEYLVDKSDGSQRKVRVLGLNDVKGHLERIEVAFNCNGDERHGWPSLLNMCDQIIAQQKTLVLA